MDTTDVIIVGAGPTGLLLAGDLAAAGVACTVLERRNHEANTTRAFGVHARTLEELDARGVADDLVATGTPITTLTLFGDVHIDLGALPSRFPYLLITPQFNTERVLTARATALGARIETGATVTGLTQDDDGVDVRVVLDGVESTRRAAYVVGTDGVHSVVRDAIHLPYPGHSVLRSIMLADVRLADAPPGALVVNATGHGFALIAPFGDGWYRIFGWNQRDQRADDVPVDIDELRELIHSIFGSDFGLGEVRWSSRFHCDERQVPHYRVDRVFLAGDAAHCHSPAGGQGMNTGIQDAANLGWKLAAVVNGWREESLLDTYDTERHPVGHMVLRSSGAIVRAATLRPWVERMARNLIGGAVLHIGPIARKAAGMVSGVGIDYPAPHGAHRSVGKRATDEPLIGEPSRLYEALRANRFVLLSREPADLTRWSDRVGSATPVDQDLPTTLVRPDGYVAWATEHPDADALTAALTEWCGEPTG